ncbi:amidase signature domain-containing protein [Alternaria rosae]|uniref:amidase signature domain-containing protein n=1 Tax=Alternaria rosae TaxID=1187941 RepID=UPI001E8CCA49|nr:amidase signature domain-containing protein [Alternaria rosae]KAH6877667.1 amidase signature domain-containing protein [Alternaria rosae]
MSDENEKPTQPEASNVTDTPDVKEVVDKIADAAPRADPRDLDRTDLLAGVKKVDQTILRLNKLLASPGGLSAFLSTFNYSLYILAYVQTKSPSISSFATKLLTLIRPACDDAKISAATLLNNGTVPPIAALAVLISKARTTLRLFGLFPLYAWLRSLASGPKAGTDVVLHRIAMLQASSYFSYQALENISLLADSGVISPRFISTLNRGDSTTARLYLYAYRCWLGGVSCDFLRLMREWQLEGRRRVTRQQMVADGRAIAEYQDEEDKKFDKRWWTDFVIASAWLPMALHFSSTTGGLPGWNLGWMGACGLVAGSTRFKALWANFNIVEASIDDHRKAFDEQCITSVDLVISCLNRIAKFDTIQGLNAFTVFNEKALQDAAASDARRAQGLKPRPLEGIPYTIKDSYKVAGMTVTDGSPALKGVMSSGDSAIAEKLRAAGAILIGKTNMPPMAAGGMQRGMYGRAESPYNSKYLTGAFSSGSSNGAATSVTSSMAVFGMGSETVSSGRSPASNNAIVCYTPSKGLLSCRGLWPLYITCDVPTPYARSVDDILEILNVIATPDEDTTGDFIREQKHVRIPQPPSIDYTTLRSGEALRDKRVGVPKMYIGQKDSDPHAKHPYVSPEVVAIWQQAAENIKSMGAEIVYTDFPLITNYENDSVSGEANNVDGRPANWNLLERGILIAQAWDAFLVENDDPKIKCLADIKDPAMLFPKPPDYKPDRFLEVRNWIDYPGLPKMVQDGSIHDIQGMEQALKALEAQRKRDLEDWMDKNGLDVVAFPAQGDVGLADLEFDIDSTTHSLQNGVKYSNGNRAIRHLGVPTVSVPMGVMSDKNMPVNITFAGKAYEDTKLLEYAYAFEQSTKRRIPPPLTPALPTDIIRKAFYRPPENKPLIESVAAVSNAILGLTVQVSMVAHSGFDHPSPATSLEVFVDGEAIFHENANKLEWNVSFADKAQRPEVLGWDLKPLQKRDIMVIVVVKRQLNGEGLQREARVLWVPVDEPDGVST